MTQVLIDRELLERAVKADASIGASSIALVDGWEAMAQIRAILAQPTQQGEVVEVAQVVSYLSACADGYDPDAPHPGPPEPLMTVAQHNRILAGVRQQRDKLAGLLDRVTTEVGRTITSELREEIDAALAETNRT